MKKKKLELYTSPQVEVIEALEQTLICESGKINEMNIGGETEW